MDKNMIVLVLLGILVLFVAYQFLQLNTLSVKANAIVVPATNTGAAGGAGSGGSAGQGSLPAQVGGC